MAGSRSTTTRSIDYVSTLHALGYYFKLNDCSSLLEVNSVPITDPIAAKIRSELRDYKYHNMRAAEDAYLADGLANRYHPVRDYLNSIKYEGGQNIKTLADHFVSSDDAVGTWLRRWLIGSVAKVVSIAGVQNRMLILDGPQGVGKSYFAQWLVPPSLSSYFTSSAINPEEKDARLRLMTTWIWEVCELQSTTRRADREALKAFISQTTVKERRAYGKYDTTGSAMASLIGTVNNSAGLLSDPTGSRRFLITHITDIDWDYSKKVDIDQLWAEAYTAYLAGETWELTFKEVADAKKINEEYKIEDPLDSMVKKYFNVVPNQTNDWLSTCEILDILERLGNLRGSRRANSMALAETMLELDLKKKIHSDAYTNNQRVKGYVGITKIPATVTAWTKLYP
jgi:predicted P-loop ATPase